MIRPGDQRPNRFRRVPAIVGAGMMGDRASVIFADPGEITAAIKHEC